MALRKKSTIRQPGKSMAPATLSDDVLTDLKHVIESFNKSDEGIGEGISRSDFKNILHNFGFYAIRQKDFEQELRSHDLDPKKPYYSEAEVIGLVTSVWCQRGREEEARDCFHVFTKSYPPFLFSVFP